MKSRHFAKNNELSELKKIARLGLLRWLHRIDLDPSSKSYGIVDREYWSWKTKDFPNATLQAGISGFLDGHAHLDLPESAICKIVSAIIHGTKRIQRKDGSFEESYPKESSVCVTALVLFNILYSYFRYPHFFSEADRRDFETIVQKAFRFLENNFESHGLISNHLATIVYAKRFARKYLDIPAHDVELENFLNLQHKDEGWFPEYGGADPGYQSLLNHYILSGAYALNELPFVSKYLEKSVQFISNFCFPDATFGGEIGSRGTSILYPSGLIFIDGDKLCVFTHSVEWLLKKYIQNIEAITPITIDELNLVPVLNSFLFFHDVHTTLIQAEDKVLNKVDVQFLKDAGLLIKKTNVSYVALSNQKGSIRSAIKVDTNKWKDQSIAAFQVDEWTTQGAGVDRFEVIKNEVLLHFRAVKRKQVFNTPFKSIVLRVMASLLAPFPKLQRVFKKRMAAYVMEPSGKKGIPLKVQIDLSDPNLEIVIFNQGQEDWRPVSFGCHQHMASANTFTNRQLL